MAKPDGQDGERVRSSSARGADTRAAIHRAAAELIAEVGWGNVTTRGVAERAGVPHGAVGYHFRGRDELLRESAAKALADMFAIPIALVSQASSITELLRGTMSWYAAGGLRDPTVALLLEALREADRDEELRGRLAELLRDYRTALTGLIGRDQARGAVRSDVTDEGLAIVIAAMVDGLVAHARLDPNLDIAAGGWALLGLLSAP